MSTAPPAPSWSVSSPKRSAGYLPLPASSSSSTPTPAPPPKHARKPSTTAVPTPLPTSYPIVTPSSGPSRFLANLRPDSKLRSLPLLVFLLLGLAALAQLRPLARSYAPLARLFPGADGEGDGGAYGEPAFWVEDIVPTAEEGRRERFEGEEVVAAGERVPAWYVPEGELEGGQAHVIEEDERMWAEEGYGEVPQEDPAQL